MSSIPTSGEPKQNRPAPWEGVALVFVLLMTLFCLSLFFGLLNPLLGLGEQATFYFLFIGEALLIIPLWLWMIFRGYNWRETLAFYPVRWPVMISAAAIAILAWPVASIIALPFEWMLSKIGPSPAIPTPESVPEAVIFGLAVAVLAPMVEEPIFRGFIMRAWLGVSAFWAIVISSLLFGLQHGQLAELVSLVVIGLFLGIVRWRSGSIVPAMMMHGLFNAISFLFLLPATEPTWLTDSNLVIINLVAAPLLGLSVFYLFRQTQVEQEKKTSISAGRGRVLLAVSAVLVMMMFGLFGLIDILSRWLPPELLSP